jgi:psiF repeat
MKTLHVLAISIMLAAFGATQCGAQAQNPSSSAASQTGTGEKKAKKKEPYNPTQIQVNTCSKRAKERRLSGGERDSFMLSCMQSYAPPDEDEPRKVVKPVPAKSSEKKSTTPK